MSELKLQELERRIRLLEGQNFQPKFNYYEVAKADKQSLSKHEFEFEMIVKTDCYLMLETSINSAIGGFLVKIQLNGSELFQGESSTNYFVLKKMLPFASGKNIITITVSSSTAFSVEECKVQTFGNLWYPECEMQLSVINESAKSIILHQINESITVKNYDGEMQDLITFEGVKSGALCKLDDNYLFVVVNKSGGAIAYLYDSNFQLKNSAELDDEINSVCAISASPAKVFAVRGNRVYRYDVFSDLSVAITPTEHRAKKVKGNPLIDGYIIIIDHADNGKLIKI